MSRDLQLRVLERARDQIATEGGYTDTTYVRAIGPDGEWVDKDNSPSRFEEAIEGAQVVQTCAIGGIEHALYLESGRVITEDERDRHGRVQKPSARSASPLGVYSQVMARLNRITEEKYGDGVDDEWRDKDDRWTHIEGPNVELPVAESRPIVLDVIDTAINELRKEEGL
jgi:hypothetical protein